MIGARTKLYCCEDLSCIENYQLAAADQQTTWHCHHRREIGPDGTRVSVEELKKAGLFWHRPASELVFLTPQQHISMHTAGVPFTKRHSSRISEAKRGRRLTEEHRMAISASYRFERHEGMALTATSPLGEVRVYARAADAAKDLKCSRQMVYKAASGSAPACRGWTLKWEARAYIKKED